MTTQRDIIVSSMPRSGSTALCRAIEGKPQGKTWNQDKADVVWKMHRPAPEELPYGASKAIYLYCDPFISALSSWRRFHADVNHFRHCGCDKPLKEIDLFEEDEMNLEKTFDSWVLRDRPYPVCLIKYQAMWSFVEEISEFVGWDIELPEWHPRRTELRRRNELMDVYGDLLEKVNEAPDFEVRE